ncbi:trimeric intracellular cation channel family protein [Kordiimonas marina]|uniref:trimeric intracellular cation channel family protein n=1 Tax=Kordiimonas marina TaxID=2872312 RepID=UPI001FF54801|nr:trimeric intracellular cation channel family protein [Kordiimonas marina]MCJ9427835.1 trimeric intracellular cation channel family protein [Kordiimonas marina]
MDALLTLFDYVGVFVFAISGALAAVRKGMDLFGIVVLALMPAVGGGTLRDLVLGQPVFWIEGTRYIYIALLGAGVTFLFAHYIEGGQGKRLKWLTWADAVGLALFCVVGAEKALDVTGSSLVATMMGVVTGVAGGMLRDVLCVEIPLVMKKGEVYATAAFIGAGTFCLMRYVGAPGVVTVWTAMAGAFIARAGGILWNWTLPKALH